MSVLRYFLPNGGDILLNFTHIMDFFAEWKAADSENNFLYHLFWFLYYNNQFKMHNNFKQTKIKRTGQSPLKKRIIVRRSVRSMFGQTNIRPVKNGLKAVIKPMCFHVRKFYMAPTLPEWSN